MTPVSIYRFPVTWMRFCVALCLSVLPGIGTGAVPAKTTAPAACQVLPFPLEEVRLLDGPFLDAQRRNEQYLLSLDPDRFLSTFRENVGLTAKAAPYGGWEEPKCELRGHSLGHYLSACSLAYAATGNKVFKERVDSIVSQLAECQAASPRHGFHEGYLSAYPESFFDRVETGKGVWAPWYTLHKVYAGL
jgi:uncharacterized protein